VLDFLDSLKRTHYCGTLRSSDAGKPAVVFGWVARRRDLGNLLFLDVRDRTGIVQVVFNKETGPEAHAKAEQARSEFVIGVEGRVVERQKSNPDLATGQIEASFDRLLGAFQRTAGDDRNRVRVHLLELFEVLPPRDPRVAQARARLSSMLF